MFKKIYLLPLVLIIFFSVSLPCYSENSPMEWLEENFDGIVLMLQSPSFQNKPEKEQIEVIYEKLNSSVNFKIVSMLALGRNWKRFSESQKDEFADNFSKLVTNVYLSKIKGKKLDNIKVDYLKFVDLEKKDKSSISEVYTTLYHNDTQIPVTYKMIKEESKEWMIYDILIEGVSLIANYRHTYREKYSDSPEEIISELKAKIEQ